MHGGHRVCIDDTHVVMIKDAYGHGIKHDGNACRLNVPTRWWTGQRCPTGRTTKGEEGRSTVTTLPPPLARNAGISLAAH
jgi:hypothetical protein